MHPWFELFSYCHNYNCSQFVRMLRKIYIIYTKMKNKMKQLHRIHPYNDLQVDPLTFLLTTYTFEMK